MQLAIKTGIIALFLFPVFTYAQPSDTVQPPPTAASQVDKVVAPGTISLTATDSSAVTTWKWVKFDATGNGITQAQTGPAYTEPATIPGRYKYQVQGFNSTCSSPLSNIFDVFMVAPLSAVITGITTCVNTPFTLTVSAPPANYAYTYQWTRNGVNVPGANASTYVGTESVPANVSYGCILAYTILSTYTLAPVKVISVTAGLSKPVVK